MDEKEPSDALVEDPEAVAEPFIENPERKVVELIIKSIVEAIKPPEKLKLYLRLSPSRIAC